jgi:hypothetical protein
MADKIIDIIEVLDEEQIEKDATIRGDAVRD